MDKEIEQLRKEAESKQCEAERLAALRERYPDLRKYVGRWNKVVYCSASVNSMVDQYEHRYNCGCCSDSPLELWPYLETDLGRVHSDPPMFYIGERDYDYGPPHPESGWEERCAAKGISAAIIERIRGLFTRDKNEDENE